MFMPLTIPLVASCSNVLKLKPGVTPEDIELAIGEMCNVVKNTYGDEQGGFIGGRVFKFTGFVSEEGSFTKDQRSEDHVAILTLLALIRAARSLTRRPHLQGQIRHRGRVLQRYLRDRL